MKQDRQDRRYDVQIPVGLLSLRGETKAVTQNASYRGVLLRTEQAPPKRQLVRLRLTVPTHPTDLFTNGMVVHVADAGAGASSVGISFYGLDGEPRGAWEKFIRSVQASQGAGEAATHAGTAGGAKHKGAELVVAVASTAALERLISRDIARGALLMHAESAPPIGAAVCIRLIHPVTQGDFHLEGRVRRHVAGGGIAVDFPAMDDPTRTRLAEFAKGEEEGFEIIDFASIRPPARAMSSQAFG